LTPASNPEKRKASRQDGLPGRSRQATPFSHILFPFTLYSTVFMSALALMLALLISAAAPAQTPSPTTAQKPPFWKMARHSVDLLLQPVPQTNQLRLAQLRQTFTDLQCQGDQLREQAFDEGKNLLCTLPGTAAATLPPVKPGLPPIPNPSFGTILFIAHYEHNGPGESAVDNWTGAIMLPFLYHALAAAQRHHTFLFAEVDGPAGAKALFNSFTPDQRHAIKGVVALEALGLGPAQLYSDANDTNGMRVIDTGSVTHSDQVRQACAFFPLCTALLRAANDLHTPAPAYAIPGGWLKIDDTLEFRHHAIPTLLIHSVTHSTRDIPGTTRDTASAIDHDIYFQTVILLTSYITELDQPWPSAVINAASTPSRGRR
jgi:hypothetical protein